MVCPNCHSENVTITMQQEARPQYAHLVCPISFEKRPKEAKRQRSRTGKFVSAKSAGTRGKSSDLFAPSEMTIL